MDVVKLLVVLGLGITQVEPDTGNFCYYKATCGPASWPTTYPTCNGSEQSPINIQKSKAVRNEMLGPFQFHYYDNPQFVKKIERTPTSVKVTVNSSMWLSGGGLHADYAVAQFHLHWGSSVTSRGSEHALDGKRSSMELHIVHRQRDLSLSQAFGVREGLAVLGFFIEIENGTAEDPGWKNLTRTVKYLKHSGDHRDLNGSVSLMDLIKNVNLMKYFRYNGSLTTPECNEVVVWTVFEEPIRLNASLVEGLFRDLYVNETSGVKLLNNFRTLQMNVNPVWASAAVSADTTSAPPSKTTPSGGAHRELSSLALLLLLTSLSLLPI
ncbi:carbonic anhydrase 4-like [Scyliorhinus torazame]|uniref:carbonic anhydrase 4-like n=1 Tax=Scyliorhinus torazame TaxID=75743 RepID=UPI003B5BD793